MKARTVNLFIITTVTIATTLFVSQSTIKSQNYYLETREYSGFDTDFYQNGLDSIASMLVEIFPLKFRNDFKVYSFGFYTLDQPMYGGHENRWDNYLDEVRADSPYYLAFGRKSDANGIFSQIYVDLRLPQHEELSCIDDSVNNLLLIKIRQAVNYVYHSYDNNPYFYPMAEEHGMKVLRSWVADIIDCCAGENMRISECTTFDELSLNPFIEFNGNKYFDEEEVVACKYSGNLALRVLGFAADGSACDDIRWEGAVQVSDTSARITGDSSMSMHKVSMSCDSNLVNINIIFNQVSFSQNNSQMYVFDSNLVEEYFQLREPFGYPINRSYDLVDNPAYEGEGFRDFPWKFIPNNKSDPVQMKMINGISAVSLSGTLDVSISEWAESALGREVSISSTVGHQNISTIITGFGDDLDCNFSRLNVFSSEIIQRDIAIVIVKNDSTHQISYVINEDDLRTDLRAIYRPAGVDLQRIDFFNVIYDYDLNNNNLVDVLPLVDKFGVEVQPVVDYFKEDPRFEPYQGVLFVFDAVKTIYTSEEMNGGQPRETNPRGKMPIGQKFGVMYFGRSWYSENERIKTVAHELGHGLFRLKHPFDEFDLPAPPYYIKPDGTFGTIQDPADYIYGPDPLNLMNINPDGIELIRTYQIQQIHNE